jgi:hypothetical protein
VSSHTSKLVLQITAVVLSAAALMSVPDARENTLSYIPHPDRAKLWRLSV